MIKKISLKNEVDINGQKVNELNLNFDNLTGNDLLVAEETARTLGDKTPAICYSMRYQAIIGAKAANVAISQVSGVVCI